MPAGRAPHVDTPDEVTVNMIGCTALAVGDRVRVFGLDQGVPLRLEPDPAGAWIVAACDDFLYPSPRALAPIPSMRLTLRRVGTDPG